MLTVLPPRVIDPGVYKGHVVDSAVRSYVWRKSEENPDGICLKIIAEVRAEDGKAHVVDAIDWNYGQRLKSLFSSCGLAFDPDLEDIAHRHMDLLGSTCRLLVKTIVPRAGKNQGQAKSVVSSWI